MTALACARPQLHLDEPWRDLLVAASEPMRRLLERAARAARSTVPVLLLGETGTGKDLLAHVLHEASGRRGAFVPVNCTAIPVSMAESELFGHVRGAFTDARQSGPGLFAHAHEGTLLLDEIGDLDLAIQAKLLRIVEDGLVRPVGGPIARRVDVRIVAATNRDLAAAVREGSFRADLYHRLAGVTLVLPPLRDRPADIEPLTRRFLAEAMDGRPVPSLSPAVEAWLATHSWPGNVRELRQAVRRAVLGGQDVLTLADFDVPEVESGGTGTRAPADLGPLAMDGAGASEVPAAWLAGKSLADIEASVIAWALRRCGSIRGAARALRMPHSTLADRVHRLGLAR